MQTSAPHIYAAGDCTGPHEIVHIAVQQGEIAAHNIAHPNAPRRMDYRLLISVVFTEPQVAFVGLTEKEAKARGHSVSGGELSVQRPRQIAHHGGEGRLCETAGGSEDPAKFSAALASARSAAN